MQNCFSLCLFRLLLTAFCAVLLFGCGKDTESSYPYADSRGEAIAASARSQIGRPYCRGGISPQSGFDCSGLVYWACAQNGVSVPRMTREQAKAGQSVKRSALRPGDIVVFKTSWTGYHTGIYIGQDKFIHSPRPRAKVRIESLSIDYWKKYFVTARRVARR